MTTTQEKTNGQGKNGKSTREEADGTTYYQDAYTFWGDFYQRMADQGMEFFQQGMEMAQSMTPMYADNEAFRVWKDSYQEMLSKMGASGMPGMQGGFTGGFPGPFPGPFTPPFTPPFNTMDPAAYQKMYDFWLESSSRAFDAYMKTPEFAAKSGKGLEAFSDMSAKSGEMLEAYWQFLHLPSAQDMREIYQKLYVIERKLDEMDKRQREATPRAAAKKQGD